MANGYAIAIIIIFVIILIIVAIDTAQALGFLTGQNLSGTLFPNYQLTGILNLIAVILAIIGIVIAIAWMAKAKKQKKKDKAEATATPNTAVPNATPGQTPMGAYPSQQSGYMTTNAPVGMDSSSVSSSSGAQLI